MLENVLHRPAKGTETEGLADNEGMRHDAVVQRTPRRLRQHPVEAIDHHRLEVPGAVLVEYQGRRSLISIE